MRPTKPFLSRAARRFLTGAVVLAVGVFGLVLANPADSSLTAAAAPITAARASSPTAQSAILRGQPLFITSDTPAARAYAQAAPTDTTTRNLLQKIKSQPQALWLGGWLKTDKARAKAATLVADAKRTNSVLPLVLYNVPMLDCHSYSGGGAPGDAAYRAWVDQIALGLAGGRTMVVLEPDALPLLDCLTPAQQTARVALIKYAATQLASTPGVAVYIDAGHSQFRPANVIADRLKRAGVSGTAGFALNVSNFKTTASQVTYGRTVSGLVSGAHFVIDTSRNGLGPATGDLSWCNPQGRALGLRPTTSTNDPLIDAYLWVKTVGLSDGNCRPGEPAAGIWWEPYALGLASRAAW